jgi:hypothetical protein
MRALRDAIKASGMTLAAIDIKDMVLRHLPPSPLRPI